MGLLPWGVFLTGGSTSRYGVAIGPKIQISSRQSVQANTENMILWDNMATECFQPGQEACFLHNSRDSTESTYKLSDHSIFVSKDNFSESLFIAGE